ncbi:MAG TPA: hypothetical protein VFI23_12170 [Rhizomicrobium sp.]|nr:hypothetical protein [Rhizomicrobium sp.]
MIVTAAMAASEISFGNFWLKSRQVRQRVNAVSSVRFRTGDANVRFGSKAAVF